MSLEPNVTNRVSDEFQSHNIINKLNIWFKAYIGKVKLSCTRSWEIAIIYYLYTKIQKTS